MAYPDAVVIGWASAVLAAGVTVVRGLRHGGSPWLVRAGDREVVLRVAEAGQAAQIATEVAAMTCAAQAAGAAVPVADHRGAPGLLRAADAAVAATRPGDSRSGLVHGDLWYGNTLWEDGRLAAVLDWDCAGVGPAGIDLGSLRCDAAWCYGVGAAEHVLSGWEAETGRPASNVGYWDTVAALTSPPDMGWFPMEMADHGRPDLTREVMLERRDAFLDAALSRLTTAG